jgi:hypothetical protein
MKRTEHQVFTTILDCYPELADRVPRLFPGRSQAAQFLGTQVIDLGDGGGELRDTFVLHYWQPADNAGAMAVAYPASYITSWQPDAAATALLERIDVSAVAVPDGTRDILPNGDLGEASTACLGGRSIQHRAVRRAMGVV